MGSANHNSGESGEWQMMNFQPMPLLKRAAPFDDPDWIYELKMDGFRALAIVEHGRAQLLSRNGHPFASFSELGKQIAVALPNVRAVIDGEICSLDRRGKPQFKNLLFHRGNPPCFFAFDLLTCDGKDCLSVSGITSLLQVGMRALSLVKHAVILTSTNVRCR